MWVVIVGIVGLAVGLVAGDLFGYALGVKDTEERWSEAVARFHDRG